MKIRRPRMDIENKILIPFVCISLATVICFCAILYFTEYRVKVAAERENASTLIGYIQADLELEDYRQDPKKLLAKYRNHYTGDSLFIYDEQGELLLGKPGVDAEDLEVLAQATDPQLGWEISYRLDNSALQERFIEEQKYMILAAVAMLVIIVQASVLIAHNISDPIRRLSEVCQSVSESPEQEELDMEEYLGKADEVGQLARAFARMMESIRTYTGELIRVKTLNESIVENLPFGVVAYDQEGKAFCVNASASAMLAVTGPETTTPSAWRGEAVKPMPKRPRSKLTLPVAPSSISTDASPPAETSRSCNAREKQRRISGRTFPASNAMRGSPGRTTSPSRVGEPMR